MTSPRHYRERYRIGDLELDLGQVRVVRDGVELGLPPLSFRLLLELARIAPDVARPDELLDRVWAGVIVNEETLKQRVKLLRQALGESGRDPRYVRTVRATGYQLIPEVIAVPGDAVAGDSAVQRPGVAAKSPDGPSSSGGSWLRRALRPLGLGASVLTAVALVIALGVDLTTRPLPAADQPSPPAPPVSAPDSAEALYEVGRQHFVRRGPEALARARDAFRRAAERDPGYAPAWAGQSDAGLMLLLYGEADWEQTLRASGLLLERAEAAGGHRSVVDTSRGLLAWMQGDVLTAERLFTAAIDADGHNPLARLWLGTLHLQAGQPESAREHLTHARRLAPLDPVVLTNLGEAYMSLGEFDTGVVYLSLAAQAAPDLGLLAIRAVSWAWEYGELEVAQAWTRRAEDAGGDPHGVFAALRARTQLQAGDPDGARALMRKAGLDAGTGRLDSGPAWAVEAKRSAALRLAVADRRVDALRGLAELTGGPEIIEGWRHEVAEALYVTGDYPGMVALYGSSTDGALAELGPMDQAWQHVSLAVACERLGDVRQARAHADAASEALQAHGGREPRVSLLRARLAAVQGRETAVFSALQATVASGWVNVGALDNDPVFAHYRNRTKFVDLRAQLRRRQEELRQRMGASDADLRLAAAATNLRHHR
jgi:DNA-binding winged helix-turn-helix (wHTH) protein